MFIDLLRHFCPGTGTTKLYAKRAPKAEAKAFTSVWGQSNQLKQLLQKASQLREVLLSFHFHDPAHVCVCVCECTFFTTNHEMHTVYHCKVKQENPMRATGNSSALDAGFWNVVHNSLYRRQHSACHTRPKQDAVWHKSTVSLLR